MIEQPDERNYFCTSIAAEIDVEGSVPALMRKGDKLTVRGPGRMTVIYGTVKLLTHETEAEWEALVAEMYPPDEEQDDDELVDRIFEFIDAWTATKTHNFDCIGYSEGQLCCLDKEHPARPVLRALIKQSIYQRRPT